MTPESSYAVKTSKLPGGGLRKGKRPLLSRLDIELTERCNNNCMHCCINLPENDPKAKSRETSTGRIKTILSEAASLGCLTVRLTGGEPLLRQDFSEIYLFARRLGIRVMIFTNATLITEELAELWRKYPPLELVEVSLYGMSSETYESVTRKAGSFKAAMRGMDLLKRYEIPFGVKWVNLPLNFHETDNFDKWVEQNCRTIKKTAKSTVLDLRHRRDSESLNNSIKKLRWSPAQIVELQDRGGKSDELMNSFCKDFMGARGAKLFACQAGDSAGCVDAYGILQPCLSLRDSECSVDLQNSSLERALRESFPAIRIMKATNPEYLERCGICSLKGLCDQCPAKSWIEHGTLDRPVDYLCEIAHITAEQYGIIECNGKGWEP